jgi:hypothetical protein
MTGELVMLLYWLAGWLAGWTPQLSTQLEHFQPQRA